MVALYHMQNPPRYSPDIDQKCVTKSGLEGLGQCKWWAQYSQSYVRHSLGYGIRPFPYRLVGCCGQSTWTLRTGVSGSISSNKAARRTSHMIWSSLKYCIVWWCHVTWSTHCHIICTTWSHDLHSAHTWSIYTNGHTSTHMVLWSKHMVLWSRIWSNHLHITGQQRTKMSSYCVSNGRVWGTVLLTRAVLKPKDWDEDDTIHIRMETQHKKKEGCKR